ncbi:hypothetical protein [Spirosoma sp.]|uniref:hypothetical protein n=1 Tax=Spirosoma sp. TaxID=1899569 RepID=UPI0026044E8B|nr:hypothetical protein [Spirosoma sp.]MCX6214687.1 hypothetical protein [Spirosoma sp.]
MKHYVYLFIVVASFMGLVSCNKNNDPAPPPAVVGRWELNRGIASSFPASLSINGAGIDLYYLNSEGSTLDIYSDNTFNENYRNFGVSDGEGTWDYTNNTLTLKYNGGSTDAYTYAKNKNIEELSQVTPLSYSFPISSTATATGKIQWVYRK